MKSDIIIFLNFSQISRKILSPYVKLTQSIKIERQNTLEERIVLNFEEDNYLIIVGWDRLFIKGQGNIKAFTGKNSPFQMPFLDIFRKISALEEFGSVQNSLFAINYVAKHDLKEEELFKTFKTKLIKDEVEGVFETANDLAITLEEKGLKNEISVSFGPYFGPNELSRRPIPPINMERLGDINFHGIMMEYKHLTYTNDISFDDFSQMIEKSYSTFERLWKIL